MVNVSLCIWKHMPLLDMVCAYLNIYTYVLQSTASLQSTAVVRVLNSSECSDIPNGMEWKTKGPMRTTASESGCQCLAGHEHGRKELLGTCIKSLSSSNPSVPGICKLEKILVDLSLDHA